MRKSFFFSWVVVLTIVVSWLDVSAQEMGKWTAYFSYNQAKKVFDADDKVYAISNGALFSVEKETGITQTYTKIDGLSDNEVSTVGYSEEYKTLVIAYSNGNIDLLRKGNVYNISDLKRKEISGKTVHSITTNGRYAYLACDLGIVVVDMKKDEISDTYVIGDEGAYMSVYKVVVQGDSIYAQTQSDIRSAKYSNRNLVDYKQWSKRTYSKNNIKGIANVGEKIYVADANAVYYVDADTIAILQQLSDLKFIYGDGSSMIIMDDSTLYNYSKDMTLKESREVHFASDGIYDTNSDTYWICRAANIVRNTYGYYNLYRYVGEDEQVFMNDGLVQSSVYCVRYQYGKLITGSGGPHDLPDVHTPGIIQIYEDGKWTVIDGSNENFESVLKSTNIYENAFENVLDVAVDPADHRRMYVASWRSIFEFYDNVPIKQYWADSTPLSNIGNQTLTNGLYFDADNNMYMLNMLAQNSIVIKKADGEWTSLYYSILANHESLRALTVTKNGFMWIASPDRGVGVAVIDPKNTPFISSDDESRFFSSLTDKDGNTVTPNAVRCFAEDRNNVMWIGTSSGPFLVSSQKDIFSNSFRFDRVKITREDDENYADFLLSSNQINKIVVDGGNRKWLASSTTGVYLLSEDGKTTLQHFTTDNSPMTSNAVIDMALNEETGELFIATSGGLFSYVIDATEPSADYSNVYVYPNPVTPDYDGDVVVKGLSENSLVRIADPEGRLIYEGYSNGGAFTWNGNAKSGRRVATGVYFIFAAQEDGSMKMVTKVAFVH